MKPDAKGWYPHEKAGIVLFFWAFRAIQATNGLMRRLHLPHAYLPDSRVWLWLASKCWLYSDLTRYKDMPEHQRVGGIWR